MTVLESLRKRAGLLVAVIGFAILSFVLADMLGNKRGPGLFGGRSNDLGSINGHSVSYEEFQGEVEYYTHMYPLMYNMDVANEQVTEEIREQAWQSLIHKYVYDVAYDDMGIVVSGDELFDLVQGRNPSPLVVSSFSDRQTGEFDRANVLRFLQDIDNNPEGKEKWLFLEKQIISQRKQIKLAGLVTKAMYVTNADAQNSLDNEATSVNLQYVGKTIAAYPDSLIKVSSSDVKKYYNEHKNQYKQTESRDLEFVAFAIAPSPEDDHAAREWIEKLSPEFKAVGDVAQFVTLHSDVPFDAVYHKQGELSAALDAFAFSAEKSDMFDITLDNSAYRIARVADAKMLPDSVKARHILLQGQASIEAARTLADSIRTALKKGADFAALAAKYSQDAEANKKDGDLGWFTQSAMVKPFGDSCFFASKGRIMVVETQFGVHVVQVTDKGNEMKKVQLGVITRNVEPSKITRERIFSQANELASMSDNQAAFTTNADAKGFARRTAQRVTINDKSVSNLQGVRELVRWAYNDAKKGTVSPVFEVDNNFVVATLTDIRKDGFAEVAQVSPEISAEVLREKKAAAIAAEMRGAADLNALAEKLNTTVKTLDNVTFASFYLTNVGVEPKLAAVASASKEGVISSPVEGLSGVYVLSVSSATQGASEAGLPQEKSRLQAAVPNRIAYELFDAILTSAEVKDRRGWYY
jgi:peptidyl-prolyl cis-trans isomerase D